MELDPMDCHCTCHSEHRVAFTPCQTQSEAYYSHAPMPATCVLHCVATLIKFNTSKLFEPNCAVHRAQYLCSIQLDHAELEFNLNCCISFCWLVSNAWPIAAARPKGFNSTPNPIGAVSSANELPIPAQRCQGWRGVNSKGVEELPNQNKHMTLSSSSSSFLPHPLSSLSSSSSPLLSIP